MAVLKEGDKVPDFSMPASNGETVSRNGLKGKSFVLYFYPKDDTPGCTREACGFRDNLSVFNDLGITVIGVSKDNLENHRKFTGKYGLTFPLASDEDGRICEAFGVWVEKSLYGRKYMGIDRATFLIDETGIIRKIWRKVKVPGHVEDVIREINALKKA